MIKGVIIISFLTTYFLKYFYKYCYMKVCINFVKNISFSKFKKFIL
jgi:hypothetical protein